MERVRLRENETCPNSAKGDGPRPVPPPEADRRPGAAGGSFRTTLRVIDGICVMTCLGSVNAGSLRACASALAAALSSRPEWIVADLRQVALEPESLPVLSMMRRCSERHGTRFVLAAVSSEGRRMLQEARVSALFLAQPTVPLAVAQAGALSRWNRQRSAPPR
jgi:hypothetical protein